MNEQEMKDWIDKASYEDLLRKFRFESIGSHWCCGELGDYFESVLNQRRHDVGPEEHTRCSKKIGW
jgi:hypothetical protein